MWVDRATGKIQEGKCEKDNDKYNLMDSCKQFTKCFRTVLKTSLRFFCEKNQQFTLQ